MSDLHMALWITLVLTPGACHQPLLSLSPLLLVHTLRVARASPRQSELFPPMLAGVIEAPSRSRQSLKPLDAFSTHGRDGPPWPSEAWDFLQPIPSSLCEETPGQSLRAPRDPGFWLLEVSCVLPFLYQPASLSECPRGLFFHSPLRGETR